MIIQDKGRFFPRTAKLYPVNSRLNDSLEYAS
jgi:hypothetical protein